MIQARVELLNRLDIYEPTCQSCLDDHSKNLKVVNTHHRSYTARPKPSSIRTTFTHFPCILGKDDRPWRKANRYLLMKARILVSPNYRTLTCIARDLVHFRRWLDDCDIDYLQVSKRVMARPTYRYCGHLHDLIRSGEVKASTAKRRLCSIQNFYRWIQSDGYEFKHPLWRESDSYIKFKDNVGKGRSKKVKSTDLSRTIRVPPTPDHIGDYIHDGGKLRPLLMKEQRAVVRALIEIANTEMTLSFLLALFTGARLQTVFTLRLEQFSTAPDPGQNHIRMAVGGNTLVNTKNQKPLVIEVPKWLHEKVRIYISSERYLRRIDLSEHEIEENGHQYVFLTRVGRPYYVGNNDEHRSIYSAPPSGNAISQFMRQQLLPALLSNGETFSFRFHDLRASFGLNLISMFRRSYVEQDDSDPNQPSYFRLLMYVRERMGHASIRTTERYLEYGARNSLVSSIQDKYESYLNEIIDDLNVAYVVD